MQAMAANNRSCFEGRERTITAWLALAVESIIYWKTTSGSDTFLQVVDVWR